MLSDPYGTLKYNLWAERRIYNIKPGGTYSNHMALKVLKLLLMWPGNVLCPFTSHVRYCLHKSRPFVPYLGLSQLTPQPRILCAQLFPFLCAPLSPRHSFALSIPECYVLHLRVFSDSPHSLRCLRATCLNAMAVYGGEKSYCGLFPSGFQTKTVYIFRSSHACYTFYLFHPASVFFIIIMRVE